MKTTHKRPGCQVLAWRRIGVLTDHFALYAGDHELAVLRIGGLTGPMAQLDAVDLRLAFLSDGMAGRCIHVRDASTNVAVARFERNWRNAGGTLRLAEGGQLRWTGTGGRWGSERAFVNGDGDALVRFAPDGTVNNLVTEDPPAAELLLVLALGWLLMRLAREVA
ncbi:MAG: hypothetical protein ACRDTT_01520 [Pseudonocardiaceae bacterium]